MPKIRMSPALREVALRRRDVSAWNEFPFNVPAITTFASLDITSRVLFFVGENGSGKSTLLEAIALACGFGREGGTRNFTFSTQNDDADRLNPAEAAIDRLADALTLTWRKRPRDGFFLRAESFYNVASYLDRVDGNGPYGGISLHARSHGESFLTLLLERFSGNGLYLIDEPEAALSAARQLALLARMRDLLAADADTQFIIATHSPIVLAYPDAHIYAFDRGPIAKIAYHDTDAYVITRRFLDDPSRMLTDVFAD